MSDRLMKQMMPDEKIHKIDLHEGVFIYSIFNNFFFIIVYLLCIYCY